MEDLKPDTSTVKKLLEEVKGFFREKRIIMKSRADKNEISTEQVQNSQWIKDFIIPAELSAFYLQIDSPEDIETLNNDLERNLVEVQDNLKNFLNNNSDLEEPLKKKVSSFISLLLKAQTIIKKGGLKKSLKAAVQRCTDVEELREESGRLYAKFIKEHILEQIIVPSYEGLRHNPNEEVYRIVVKEMNQFLAKLGVMTIQIDEGEIWKDNSPYKPAAETNSDEYKTTNEQEKDIIKAVLRYAYAFQENKGEDNLLISDGEVIVMVYQPEGV